MTENICKDIINISLQTIYNDGENNFLIKFLADESYANIIKNLETQNLEEAFRAAHNLKGVCQNLGLDRLYKSSYDVTEALRNGKNDVTPEMMEKLESDYDVTVSSIRELQ